MAKEKSKLAQLHQQAERAIGDYTHALLLARENAEGEQRANLLAAERFATASRNDLSYSNEFLVRADS